jgi:hypothetical protein
LVSGRALFVQILQKMQTKKAPPNVGKAFNLTPKINHYFRFFNITLLTSCSLKNCGR